MPGRERIYAFGEFRLDAARRLLSRNGEIVALSSGAVDTLLHLVERAGETVSKPDLMAAVWPHVTVTGNSLNQAVSALRHALGDRRSQPRFIATVPGRGYRFIAQTVPDDERSHDPVAYQHYVAGWSKVTRPSRIALDEAKSHFETALGIEPEFAAAWLGVTECCHMYSAYSFINNEEILPIGLAAAKRALAIDPKLVDGHVGVVRMEELLHHDLPRAEALYRGIIAGAPRCYSAHRYLGAQMMHRQHLDEAMHHFRRAQAIEPLSVTINAEIGMAHYFSGRYSDAIDQLNLTLAMDPAFEIAHAFLGRCFVATGEYDRAASEFGKAPTSVYGALSGIPIVWAMTGREADARAAIAGMTDLSVGKWFRSHDVSQIHAALGDDEDAIDWIENDFDNHPFFAVDPLNHHLHGAPRFERLVQRLNSSNE
jgi:DNA-binding winged helix-turn-helix (wHTH) protein